MPLRGYISPYYIQTKFPSPLSMYVSQTFLEAQNNLKMPSCTKKKALIADVSSDSWLITIWLFPKSPNCPSLNAKVVSEFSFLQALRSCIESVAKVMVKSCKLSPRISTALSFLQRSSERRIVFCREKQHSLCRRTTFIPLLKCFMHLHCWDQICLCMPVFQKKSLGFSRLVVEYVSANQPDKEIRYASICTEPGHKP